MEICKSIFISCHPGRGSDNFLRSFIFSDTKQQIQCENLECKHLWLHLECMKRTKGPKIHSTAKLHAENQLALRTAYAGQEQTSPW